MEKMKKRKQERENYNKNKQEKRTINQECTNIEGITLLALVITIALNASRGHNEKLLVSKMQNESKKEESANKKL